MFAWFMVTERVCVSDHLTQNSETTSMQRLNSSYEDFFIVLFHTEREQKSQTMVIFLSYETTHKPASYRISFFPLPRVFNFQISLGQYFGLLY